MDVYEIELEDGGLLIRWFVSFNGTRLAVGTEYTVQAAIEKAQHAVDGHCGQFFGIAA